MNTEVKEGTVIKHKQHYPFYKANSGLTVYAASRDVRFTDEDGCDEFSDIKLYKEELKENLGKRRHHHQLHIWPNRDRNNRRF